MTIDVYLLGMLILWLVWTILFTYLETKMPLKKGSSKATIGKNISELIGTGRPVKQSAAIAYKEAGMAKKKKKPPTKR